MLKRIQTVILEKYLKKFPIVLIIGARQVGKTTLVRHLLKTKRKYFSFDDETEIIAAKENPESFLTQAKIITLDEAQKVPEVFPALKRIVDEKRIAGRFVVTGSSNITMLPKIKETLAGRAVYIEMDPLTIFESLQPDNDIPKLVKILTKNKPKQVWDYLNSLEPMKINIEELIFRGGYPDAWLEKNNSLRNAWFKGYVRSYLERDVRDISQIKNLYEYRKFLALAAFRSGQILGKSDLARDAGIPYSTANHFFNLLLVTFQAFVLEPYYKNIGKRLIKAPKLMWNDTGLAIYLQGLSSWGDVERLGRAGHLVENKIAIEIKILLSSYFPLAKLFYWRTGGGAEVDFVIENGARLIPVEIKWAEKIDHYDIKGLESFLKDFESTASWGLVLYRGKNIIRIKNNIFLVPFNYILC